ncbi:hypothetical protein D3C87_1531400 [compost metagenome]
MAQGAKAVSSRAIGRISNSLLRMEPTAILPMIGSSRLGDRPVTYFGVTAASSITTPAALLAALPEAAPTSSIEAAANLAMPATSSIRAISPEGMGRTRRGGRNAELSSCLRQSVLERGRASLRTEHSEPRLGLPWEGMLVFWRY